MAHNNLSRFDRDGLELLIDSQTGESFASISGYARMANINKSTVSRRLDSVALEQMKTAEVVTEQGLRTVSLIPGKLACQWLAKDNPELLAAMSEFGWNGYCHHLAGFKLESTATIDKPNKQLPDAVEYAREARLLHETTLPAALKQLILDKMGDELVTQKALTSVEPLRMGVAQRAEELGFAVTQSNRSSLGKFIKAQGFEATKEKRLCNGELRSINVYEITPELDRAIATYFN